MQNGAQGRTNWQNGVNNNDFGYNNTIMKKVIFLLTAVLFSVAIYAESAKNDTIVIQSSEVSQWIEEPSVTTTGKQTIRYYALFKGELLSTTKTTVSKAKLCKKYNAKCVLYVIGKRTNNIFRPKRIVVG